MQSLKAVLGLTILLGFVSVQEASARAPQGATVLNSDVTVDSPVTVFSGAPRQIDAIDVNWRGARGQSVKGYLYADGIEIWSGMIPAYDPTFRAAPNRMISTLEIRVDSGSAFVNWVQVYGSRASTSTRCKGRCDLNFIGSLNDAGELAEQLIDIINGLQGDAGFEANQNHFLPLKVAAAKVYEVSVGSGNYRRFDVYSAVVALEQEFRRQQTFLRDLMQANNQFQPVMAIMTIRERYRSLFGSTDYPMAR